MKTTLIILVFLVAGAGFCFGAPINGGFESGLTDLTGVSLLALGGVAVLRRKRK